jgi:hypothetical protein
LPGVVDLEPELAQACRLDQRRPSGIGRPRDRLVAQHPRAAQGGGEVVHVEPGLGAVELPLAGVAGDQLPEGERPTRRLRGGDRVQELGAGPLHRDPVRRRGIDGVGDAALLEPVQVGNVQRRALGELDHRPSPRGAVVGGRRPEVREADSRCRPIPFTSSE